MDFRLFLLQRLLSLILVLFGGSIAIFDFCTRSVARELVPQALADEDGDVEGIVTYTMWIISDNWILTDLESDLTGTFDDGEVELEWEGEADMDGHYDDQLVIGWAYGELE